jgi:hypothetical protein
MLLDEVGENGLADVLDVSELVELSVQNVQNCACMQEVRLAGQRARCRVIKHSDKVR